MAILSSNVLISSLSLLHLTVAYFLHTSPETISRHGMVLVLSGAFELPVPTTLTTPSTGTSLLACLFAFFGTTDLFAANLPEELSVFYWSSQAPLRTAFFMALASWSWLAGPKGIQAMGEKVAGAAPTYGGMSDGFIFAWAFLELVMWFWIFLTVRDERRAIVLKNTGADERS